MDDTGKPYEIHHVGQKQDSPFAILTSNQHKSNYKTIHKNTGQTTSNIDRNAFSKEKEIFGWIY
ncbi:HNH/ENDO VII family nuclease [Erysipelatoclostridium ramosum]|nr:HNH/ENDO VII family nuclease [Thomasclavelia ramosa]MBV4097931.1 HNH/ENDO VII family nuclease [Thomasclavelia ramosa]MBV4119778.1 HNH/ENDO VII family nuclease [Thomasclavelia ramosa]MCB6437394.1 HNH/ENDO VII family nuclease [Thomasclavelia ramosa]MCB6460444.1 HNH/ENDO VII family nuclease [Thomasclavelia ramosa]